MGILGLRTTDQLTTGDSAGGFKAIKSTYNPQYLIPSSSKQKLACDLSENYGSKSVKHPELKKQSREKVVVQLSLPWAGLRNVLRRLIPVNAGNYPSMCPWF